MKILGYCLIIICLSSTVCSQKCGQPNSADQIQSGTLILKEPALSTDYTLPLPFKITYDKSVINHILSISNIQQLISNEGIYYAVVGRYDEKTNNFIIKTLIDQNGWGQLEVHYFISTRQGFYTFYDIVNPFTSAIEQNLGQLQIPISINLAQYSGNYGLVTFISGLKSRSRNFKVNIVNSIVDESSAKILVLFEINSNSTLDIIYFSCLIFPIQIDGFFISTESSTYGINGLKSISQTHEMETDQFNICREVDTCKQNEIYSQQIDSCVCKDGYHLIAGLCDKCQQRQIFDGQNCVCNYGFYRDQQDSCQQCHETCGNCLGPQQNQCVTCVDITYQLNQGECKRSQPCHIGLFFNDIKQQCENCSPYCQKCSSKLLCDVCAPGFSNEVSSIFGVTTSSCQPICGNGRVNKEQQCDDDNKDNGDGCSELCRIESGWICTNGSSIQKSKCEIFVPGNLNITLKANVLLLGKVIQSVRLPFIPQCLRINDCEQCSNIIKVEVTKSLSQVDVQVLYIPYSNGQFAVSFIFPNQSIHPIEFTVQLNDQLPSQNLACLTSQELSQIVTGNLDYNIPAPSTKPSSAKSDTQLRTNGNR